MKKLVRIKASVAFIVYRLFYAFSGAVNAYEKLILDIVHDLRKESEIYEN